MAINTIFYTVFYAYILGLSYSVVQNVVCLFETFSSLNCNTMGADFTCECVLGSKNISVTIVKLQADRQKKT